MKIVYNAFSGRYCDNPRALYEELVVRSPDHDHLWLAGSAHLQGFPPGVPTVPYGSAACIEALEAADVLVSNDHIPLDWVKRPGTVYLQTWHGTPLKRIHHDVRWAPEGRLARLDLDVARWDHLLSPNRASTERLQNAFGLSGQVHETGYPRNDLLSSPRQAQVRADVRKQVGVPDGVTAVLYAPTWRDDQVFAADQPDFTLQLDLEDFGRRLGSDHVLLLRVHSLVADRLTFPPSAPVVDVSNYPDIRDLYAASDVLVTDYSSAMFDFAVTGRPILLFTYDLENYRDRLRGFYFDLTTTPPGPLLRTSAEVVDALFDLDHVTAAHKDDYKAFRQLFCHLEDGHATDRVIERIFADPTGSTQSKPQLGGEYDYR
jgi:CDP-glycerol glycerophosphotransferase